MKPICKCVTFYSPLKKSLLRYCPNCPRSTGGTTGNVSHDHNCKHLGCLHEYNSNLMNHCGVMDEDIYEWYYGPFGSPFIWTRKEEQQLINILTLQKTLYKDIQKKLLDFDKKLFERAEQLISLKTKKEIYIPRLLEYNI
tara:strand:+ start:79 stop:498 length:420 start_codon:yes stop_codon:yes gene_type:complete